MNEVGADRLIFIGRCVTQQLTSRWSGGIQSNRALLVRRIEDRTLTHGAREGHLICEVGRGLGDEVGGFTTLDVLDEVRHQRLRLGQR